MILRKTRSPSATLNAGESRLIFDPPKRGPHNFSEFRRGHHWCLIIAILIKTLDAMFRSHLLLTSQHVWEFSGGG